MDIVLKTFSNLYVCMHIFMYCVVELKKVLNLSVSKSMFIMKKE